MKVIKSLSVFIFIFILFIGTINITFANNKNTKSGKFNQDDNYPTLKIESYFDELPDLFI